MKNNTIYVITHSEFNHEGIGKTPIDPRFIQSEKNYIYFLIDNQCPAALQGKNIIYEKTFGEILQKAGKTQLAEWTFLLAEAEHSFCEYPLFFISSRFYQKNYWLAQDLDEEWDRLFSYFDEYEYGVLPSYDRKFDWYDIWVDASLEQHKQAPFTFYPAFFALYQKLYGIAIPDEYRYSSDFWCNYIGFRDRSALLDYVNFHKKIINYFFNEKYELKVDLSEYILSKNRYRDEKPFTFALELYSKAFFFDNQKKYFGLHYDGYYEIDERQKKYTQIFVFKKLNFRKLYRIITHIRNIKIRLFRFLLQF